MCSCRIPDTWSIPAISTPPRLPAPSPVRASRSSAPSASSARWTPTLRCSSSAQADWVTRPSQRSSRWATATSSLPRSTTPAAVGSTSGATIVVDATADDVVARIAQAVDGQLVYAIDFVNNTSTGEFCQRQSRPVRHSRVGRRRRWRTRISLVRIVAGARSIIGSATPAVFQDLKDLVALAQEGESEADPHHPHAARSSQRRAPKITRRQCHRSHRAGKCGRDLRLGSARQPGPKPHDPPSATGKEQR